MTDTPMAKLTALGYPPSGIATPADRATSEVALALAA